MIFQDALTALHPFFTIGNQIVEAYRLHNNVSKAAARSARRRDARPGRHPAAGPAGRRLPAPVLRRHAAARDDRDVAGQQPAAADRRRADHRARRDRAGPDPRPDPGAPEGVRLRGRHDHPRPRASSPRSPTTFLSCTPAGASRRGPASSCSPTPRCRTPGACSAACRRRRRRREAAGADPGDAAEPAQPAERLLLPSALRPHTDKVEGGRCQTELPELRPGGQPGHLITVSPVQPRAIYENRSQRGDRVTAETARGACRASGPAAARRSTTSRSTSRSSRAA